MPGWSRRRALHALGTAAAVALAGCSGDGGFEDPPPAEYGEPVRDYSLRKVREAAAGPLFWEAEEGRTVEEGEERLGRGYEYVSTPEDFEAVAFAADSDAAAELESFVAATDFESSSVLLESREIRECYDLRFRGVWREEDGGLRTDYCSTLRSADTACSRESRDTVGIGVRVPFSLADAGGFGSSWGSSCDPEPVAVGSGVEGGGES